VERPSRLTKRLSRVDSTDVTDAIAGSAASVRCTAPIRRLASLEVAPEGVCTSATTPGAACVPVAAWMRSIARVEPESVAVNPPESSSEPTTGPPSAAAMMTNSSDSNNVRLGRAVVRAAKAVNMAGRLLGRSWDE